VLAAAAASGAKRRVMHQLPSALPRAHVERAHRHQPQDRE